MGRIQNALNHIHKFIYFHFCLCVEVLQHIVYRGHFYIVTTIDPESKVTIKPMLHESYVEEKAEYIRSLAKKLPQEQCIAETIKEALYTFRFLIFHVPGQTHQYVQFLFDFKKPGSPFMLEINSLNTIHDRGRIQKVMKLLKKIHYYPHTLDKAIIRTYQHNFAGFYHHRMLDHIECIHIFYKKSQILEAERVTSLLFQHIFTYKGKVEVTVGDALDEYRHDD